MPDRRLERTRRAYGFYGQTADLPSLQPWVLTRHIPAPWGEPFEWQHETPEVKNAIRSRLDLASSKPVDEWLNPITLRLCGAEEDDSMEVSSTPKGPSLFSSEQLAKLVKETLPADAKPGEKVVVGAIDQHGAQVVASFKLKEHWEIQAAARQDWGGDATVGTKVILRW